MPMDLTDYKSTLVQVMAWCRQATSHYLSQCLSRSLSLYGVSRPQWVNKSACLGKCKLFALLWKSSYCVSWYPCVSSHFACKIFSENKNIYLHIISFLHIDMTQVVGILPSVRQGIACFTWPISWLLMTWRYKEPGHQQPRYWPN